MAYKLLQFPVSIKAIFGSKTTARHIYIPDIIFSDDYCNYIMTKIVRSIPVQTIVWLIFQ